MNFRQLVYGLLSYVPGVPISMFTGTGGTDTAEYCYCVWLRHLVLARSFGMAQFPSVVAELGPGDSVGVGLAALISGVDRYLALDAVRHAATPRNAKIFDELVDLFRVRAPIPGPERFPEMDIVLPSHKFPRHILDEERLEAALASARIERLRRIVVGKIDSPCLTYLAPWSEIDRSFHNAADLLISQAVMEHVDDLPAVYSSISLLLKPGAYSSHQIDFKSHGLFSAWDGHWACPDWLWTLFRGRKPYLLNREPLSTHLRLSESTGLGISKVISVRRSPESRSLARRFAGFRDEDRSTCGAYLFAAKPSD